MRKNVIRTQNFLRILRERYADSPKRFEAETGYPANMVSQIKTGKKTIGEKLGTELESRMKLRSGELEEARSAPPAAASDAVQPQRVWPLSVPLADFEALSPRLQHELDEAFTRLVLGAQAEDLLRKQSKRKQG